MAIQEGSEVSSTWGPRLLRAWGAWLLVTLGIVVAGAPAERRTALTLIPPLLVQTACAVAGFRLASSRRRDPQRSRRWSIGLLAAHSGLVLVAIGILAGGGLHYTRTGLLMVAAIVLVALGVAALWAQARALAAESRVQEARSS
jgi:peptidoglycan/LPS O-acetylase OafA/YrhL